jgi:hypothetical protein
MTDDQIAILTTRRALGLLAATMLAATFGLLPGYAAAATAGPVNCLTATTATDADNDGFSDADECRGITTLGTVPTVFPNCQTANVDGTLPDRSVCMDPNSKDVFIIYRPATTGSLLANLVNPYLPISYPCTRSDGTSWCGNGSPAATTGNPAATTFSGLSSLGLNVHQVTSVQVGSDRTVSLVSREKAVRVSESLDVSNADILGNCQWGLPGGLDGCAIYTQRAMNFINNKCNAAGDQVTDRNQVFIAYATFLFIHEAGHSMGGLAATYNSSFGGYHYATTSGFVMSQSAQYDTQGGYCNWYIPTNWNNTLDPAGVKLK